MDYIHLAAAPFVGYVAYENYNGRAVPQWRAIGLIALLIIMVIYHISNLTVEGAYRGIPGKKPPGNQNMFSASTKWLAKTFGR